MKVSSNAGRLRAFSGLLGAACALALVPAQPACAQAAKITAQTLIDRAEIDDLLTRYYYNLGHSSADSFAAFYADDAELILGKNSYKGKEGVEGAYKAAGAAPTPQRLSFAFNILLNNPLIVVTGNTATAKIVFTEIIIDKEGDAPRILTQGREFDHLVKVKGQWRFSKRQIMGAAQAWPDAAK
jgi:hypothetical protein